MPTNPRFPAAPDRRQRLRLWLIATLWTGLVAAVGWWAIQDRLRGHREQTLSIASTRADAVRDTLELTFRQLAALPINLSRQAAVQDFLATADVPDMAALSAAERAHQLEAYGRNASVQAINQRLNNLVRDFGLALAILIDKNGVPAASASADPSLEPAAASGNLRNREYFTEAMQRGSAEQFLLGRVSKAPGMYFSYRVEREGQVLGVAVIKQQAEALNRLLADVGGNLVFIADTNGVAVLGSHSSHLLQRMPGTGGPAQPDWKAIYLSIPKPVGWPMSALDVGGRKIQTVQINGLRHVVVSAPLGDHPFTTWVLAPLSDEHAIVSRVAMGAGVVWLLGCLLMWAAWRRLQLLDAALQARRELLDMAQALPLTVFRFQQSPAGKGRFSFLGRGVQELFDVDERVLQDDPTLPWRLAGEGQRSPPTKPVEFAMRRGDRPTWVLANSTPQAQPDGSTVYNGYWLDISARRQAEVRFAALFEHAPNGYLFFDRKRGVTHCNPATLKLFGTNDPQRLMGRVIWFPPLSPLAQPDGENSRERALELMRRHTSTGHRVQSCEWRFCRLDGTAFDADVSVIALEWQGEPQFCAVIQDITTRKQAEVAMQQARDAAEAASLTKSSFLANMSHELRTPMNAIIGMTHLALEDGLPDPQRDYVEKAHGSARNLLQILNDILDVSKIESGHLELERVDFDLETVIGEMADMLGMKADEKGLELLFSAAADLPTRLVGDPTRLRQVLVNLGSNAIKFTDAGEVTVGMEVLSQDATSVELHAWVRDTGVGISEEQMSRMFQPFVQLDNSTTRRFGGTGLGLVICRQLVERMGGRLWVDSRPAEGSTFHFNVRFGRSGARAPGAHPWVGSDLRGQRALLVDDNAAALEVLSSMCESLGVTVDCAEGGQRALELIAERPNAYTWILLDWKMPGMDGVACARQIVERQAQPRPCILLVTAFARDDALRASAGLPLAGVLQKPITPSSLSECLLQARGVDASAAPNARRARETPQVTDNVRQRLAGARILLVEDHPLNQELACELLRRADMEVVVASNGQEALELLEKSGPFDGVLMDCQMPVMDGYTATLRLRANPDWKHLPVIAMTASALAADRDRALASGMNAHITKPLNVGLMLRTMAEWIVSRGPPPASPDEPGPSTDWAPAEMVGAIDTADGLARCLGKTHLYRRILVGFRDANLDFADVVSAAVARSSWDEALHRVHDLKGLAGTIGAHGLHTAAKALHAALGSRDGRAADHALARVNEELAAVLEEIDRLVASA